jgi:hypothetical protein
MPDVKSEPKVEISDPLPNSQPELRSLHNVSIDGFHVGQVEVNYLGKEDVKLIRGLAKGKLKRKLEVGQPFCVRLMVDAVKGIPVSKLGKKGLFALVDALKNKFVGLEDREIYVMELLPNGEKRIVGRGQDLRV